MSTAALSTNTQDATERWGRAVVTGRSLGFCQLGDGRQGREWAHRVARGRGGSWAPVNGLWLCSWHHALTHSHQVLARRCGWMVETSTHPSQVPALIVTQTGAGWWWLDEMDAATGRPTGFARLADDEEIPADVWPPAGRWRDTLSDAVAALEGRRAA